MCSDTVNPQFYTHAHLKLVHKGEKTQNAPSLLRQHFGLFLIVWAHSYHHPPIFGRIAPHLFEKLLFRKRIPFPFAQRFDSSGYRDKSAIALGSKVPWRWTLINRCMVQQEASQPTIPGWQSEVQMFSDAYRILIWESRSHEADQRRKAMTECSEVKSPSK